MTQPTYPPSTDGNARVFVVLAFVLAALSLLLVPIILGPAAIILGVVAQRKGDPLATWAIVAGVAGMVGGFIIAAIVFQAADESLRALNQ